MAALAHLFFLSFTVFTVSMLLRLLLIKTGLIFVARKLWRRVEDCFYVYQFFKVPEFNSDAMQENHLYRKVLTYLTTLPSMEDSDFTNLFTGTKRGGIVVHLDPDQVVEDHFLGARVIWINKKNDSTGKCFVLKVRKSDKRRILRPYLQHIQQVFDEFEQRTRELRLYINVNVNGGDERWRSIPFTHPSTLDTMAVEDDLKSKVKSDLDSFLKAKQYYHRLGRVWKRSFLLYGPSGTGKSSFVAAMANYIGYDVYDIDLSKVEDDGDLKVLFLQTKSKSIVVIEDLDRVLGKNRTRLTLSGVLNFMDGILNTCCAEERVLVFTMNSKKHVDPAFLRPGRVDVHINFPLCDFSCFKILANSYLGVKDHKLFPQVKEIFQSGKRLSPAEIGELMIANRRSPSRAIKSVISALQTGGDGRVASDSDGISCKEGVPAAKEFRKLYSLVRMKSNKKFQTLDIGR